MFYYGSHLVAAGEYSVEDILTVFAMLLFCIATINAIVAFSKINRPMTCGEVLIQFL